MRDVQNLGLKGRIFKSLDVHFECSSHPFKSGHPHKCVKSLESSKFLNSHNILCNNLRKHNLRASASFIINRTCYSRSLFSFHRSVDSDFYLKIIHMLKYLQFHKTTHTLVSPDLQKCLLYYQKCFPHFCFKTACLALIISHQIFRFCLNFTLIDQYSVSSKEFYWSKHLLHSDNFLFFLKYL